MVASLALAVGMMAAALEPQETPKTVETGELDGPRPKASVEPLAEVSTDEPAQEAPSPQEIEAKEPAADGMEAREPDLAEPELEGREREEPKAREPVPERPEPPERQDTEVAEGDAPEVSSSTEDEPKPPRSPADVYDGGVQWKFGRDDQHSLRLLTWHQIWNRYTQMNPGSEVSGQGREHQYDVGLRRARLLLIGQLTDRFQILTHFGINNQTFNNARKPQMFVHEATAQIDVVKKAFVVGGGLHYWHGLSRMTNTSTVSFLGLDAPMLNWPTIEGSDQFARNLGTYVKGKIGLFDYRFALNKPFVPGAVVDPVTAMPGASADYNPYNNTVELQGYAMLQLFDQEGNAVPYLAGTYLGTKRVLNVGAGFLWHPDAMWSATADGQTREHDTLGLSADVFADIPLPKGNGAVTAYGVYYYYDFGPDHLRNVGVMNVATAGTSNNGAGNAYPTIGTGHHVFAQLGYMLPPQWTKLHRIQPYASAQVSRFDALADAAFIPEAGVNWHLLAHHLKLTATYRSRPVYAVATEAFKPQVASRRAEVVFQTQIAF